MCVCVCVRARARVLLLLLLLLLLRFGCVFECARACVCVVGGGGGSLILCSLPSALLASFVSFAEVAEVAVSPSIDKRAFHRAMRRKIVALRNSHALDRA